MQVTLGERHEDSCMKSTWRLGTALLLACMTLVLGQTSMAADTLQAKDPAAYKDLIRIKNSLIGRWIGESRYYDSIAGGFNNSSLVRNISKGPLPHTFVIDGTNELQDGSMIAGYEIMGVRADGAVIRQILFYGDRSIFKEEVVLDYSIESDDVWTLNLLEYLDGGKGSDGPGLLKVSFERTGDSWTITKSLVGESWGRQWESRTEMRRQLPPES